MTPPGGTSAANACASTAAEAAEAAGSPTAAGVPVPKNFCNCCCPFCSTFRAPRKSLTRTPMSRSVHGNCSSSKGSAAAFSSAATRLTSSSETAPLGFWPPALPVARPPPMKPVRVAEEPLAAEALKPIKRGLWTCLVRTSKVAALVFRPTTLHAKGGTAEAMSSATLRQSSRSLPRSSSCEDSSRKVRSVERDFLVTSPTSGPSSSSPASSPEMPRHTRSRKSQVFLPSKARRIFGTATRSSPHVITLSSSFSLRSSTLPTKGTRRRGSFSMYCNTASRVGSTRAWPSGLLSSEAIFASMGLGPMPAEHVSPPVSSLMRWRISRTTSSAASWPPRTSRYLVRSSLASSRDQEVKSGSYSW
mmetsp:Transcript_13292/g.36630  ORF Transcript_13292/g.36630 Transcript_13292/m.36630 type:complete len:361 (-) Transcript_13292:188-1270(-)